MRRDRVASVEKALAEALTALGYEVMNTVLCRKPLDEDMWATTKAALDTEFPGLAAAAPNIGDE